MASYNKLLILGKITADPELKQTANGVYVTSFAVAVARSGKSKDEERKTDFINAVAWRNTAEFICRHFNKGRSIFLEGELRQRSYTDKKGDMRYVWEMMVEQAQFVDSKENGFWGVSPSAPHSGSAQSEDSDPEEEFPF